MAYKIEFFHKAEDEFDETLSYYKQQKEGLEQDFHDDYLVLEKRLKDSPEQFPIIAENVRKANFSKFPFSIIFVIKQVSVFILAIFHQKRNPKAWLERIK